jgi:hypothetical protein
VVETEQHACRGAVAEDGRIEPGDMILQVNDISFEGLSNDDAVKILRETVQRPGYVHGHVYRRRSFTVVAHLGRLN